MRTKTLHASDGVPLHIWEAGAPDGPPVLLLHGLGQSGSIWRPLWESALAAQYRLMCQDLRGHGRSGLGVDPSILAQTSVWSSDVATVLDGMVIDALIVVGWSYGGVVALDHLAQHPERLRGLVLVNPPPGAGVADAVGWFDQRFLTLIQGMTSTDAQTFGSAQ